QLRSADFWTVFGVWLCDRGLWSSRPWPLDHRNQFALSVAVAVDVPLSGLDRPVTGQQLNVAQRAACLVYDPSGSGDKRPAAGMRGTAFQANVLERPVE